MVALLRALDDLSNVYVPGAEFVTGDEVTMVRSPRELGDLVMARGSKGLEVKRYKGLGEMNPEQLRSTTLDPGNRSLLRVVIGDPEQADDTCSMLMGEEVEPRRNFLVDVATKVEEVDA